MPRSTPSSPVTALLAAKQALSRKSLKHFVEYTFPDLGAGDYDCNWHHAAMCSYLDRFVAGDIRRLIIECPPRHGKSELVSRRLPAYILGRNPDASVIATAYAADLAKLVNRDAQHVIDGVRYQELFPNTRLWGANVRSQARQGVWLRNTDIFEVVNHRGVYRSAGVGGPITGMGFDYGLIDDPIKNREEADSTIVRERLWRWYVSTFYTRRNDEGASILVTMTRWHEDDLVGRLLQHAQADPQADQWTVLRFPALAEPPVAGEYPIERCDPRQSGEALWPAKADRSALESTRVVVGPYQWSALYQQRPSPGGGSILKQWWWRFWQPKGANLPPVQLRDQTGAAVLIPPEELPETFDVQMQSWDLTFDGTPGADYVVGQVWGRRKANRYLLEQLRGRWDVLETMDALRRLTKAYPEAGAKLLEKAANAAAVNRLLKSEVAGILLVPAEGSKLARVHSVVPEIASGNVYLPHPHLAPWVWEFIRECDEFPVGTNDDQCDGMTQALRYLATTAHDDTDLDLDFGAGESVWGLD